MNTKATEFIKLFDENGVEIPASRSDLLKIEAQSFKIPFYRRLLNDRSGDFWLVSDRPGKVPMVLQISVWHNEPTDYWEISFCTNGIASYSHFDIARTIETLRRRTGGRPIPDNVADLALEHVAYRSGAQDPSPDPLEYSGIKTLSARAMKRRLSWVLDENTDKLVHMTADQRMGIFPLQFEIFDFNMEHGLGDVYTFVMTYLMVPVHSWPRLTYLMRMLKKQAGSS